VDLLAFLSMSTDEEEIVRLPGPARLPVHRCWEQTVMPDAGAPYRVTMRVEMDDDGFPWVKGVFIAPPTDWPGLDAAMLARIKLDRDLEGLLQKEALLTAMETMGPTLEEIDTKGWGEYDAFVVKLTEDSEKAATASLRRHRPTRELLARVLELYDEGGIKAVQAGTNYSESYCFKLLRRARKEVAS
jgi:hypothetical protein